MAYPFFTIGHSARLVGEFVELVRQAEIRLIVDVRTIPRSRTNPQYDSEEFATVLAELQIGYEDNAALGGLRGQQHNVPADVNAFWENQSFHNYADYAMSEGFRAGLTRLRDVGRQAVRHHVCRGGVVAMSSADHR
jgi:uncharacterized protein (DUF488 family)